MVRKVSISWLKQRSGSYALKGIRISEDNRAYDSMSTFREEDAEWLTNLLGAGADIEVSGNNRSERSSSDSPEWALKVKQDSSSNAVPLLDCERAGATILRLYLSRMVEACATTSGTRMQHLANEVNAALLAINAGKHYTPDEARTILERVSRSAEKK